MNSKLVVIWSRFGPYHLARLRGAGQYGANYGFEVHGVEVAQKDSTYDWNVCTSDDGFERHVIHADRDYSSLSLREIRDGVFETLERINPIVVAINGWAVPEAQSALTWCGARPSRVAVLMSETKRDDARRYFWKEVAKRRIVRKFAAALVGGMKQKDYLLDLGFPEDRIFFGYDIVDNDYFQTAADGVRANSGSFRNVRGLPEKYFFLCTRFLRRKNVDGLLRAYAAYRMRSNGRPWGLVIAGNGEEAGVLRDLERSLGLQGVVWPGFIQYDELPLYYSLAEAFVHPAKSEAWGLVVNEAAASGLPLLVSQSVGSRYELVRDGVNGYLFNPTNIQDMCHALSRIAELPTGELARMGRRSAAIVEDWTPHMFGRGLFSAVCAARR